MEINIVPKFLDSALTPVAKETGERLAEIVNLLFTPVIKAKIKRDKNLELFLKELDDKINSIPEEDLIPPTLSIVGPALDNVFKFYHDEEHLRQMYSELIASSMNLNSRVHPSYIDVIRQLTSTDAIVLSTFLIPLETNNSPISFLKTPLFFIDLSCDCGIDSFKKSKLARMRFFLSDNRKINYCENAILQSLEVLQKLGLLYCEEEIVSNSILKEYGVDIEKCPDNSLITHYVQINLTNFGMNFVDVCCEKSNPPDFYDTQKYVKKIIMRETGFEIKYT